MRRAQETSDFYPTRRAGEAPPELVIGGGVFKPDLSDTPDLPEKGVTLKHVRETVRGILSALKGTATLVAVAVSAMLMAESITGTEGELLENLPGDSTVLLDAHAVKQLLQSKADAGELSSISEQFTTLEAQLPVVRATLPTANNNANGYGYRGPLSRLGVYGEAVVIRRLAITTRASGNLNTTAPLWARVVRSVDGAWVVCAQAKEPRRWDEVTPGSELAWEMKPVPGVRPPSADESVAIVWVNDSDAPAAQSGQVSWRTVSVAGGLEVALPTVPTTTSPIKSWSPRIVIDFTAVTKALTVDTSLSSTSTNPVQNQAVKASLDGKASKYEFNSDNTILPYVKAYGTSMHSLRTVFNANNEADNWAEKFDNAKLTFEWWHQYDNVKEDSFDVPMTAFRALANGGGGNTEVWKGNVGFGEQDTFFGPRRVADGEGQFLNGYPRLHNHGQDIHEVSGFSRDSRDDETVWSHRLLLPWDLAKANDTSYLMAGVVWESTRLGVNTRFVQPLLPTNTPEATTALGLPYALPCFENSPIFWNGHLIFDDGSGVKQITLPWSAVNANTTAKIPIIRSEFRSKSSQLSIQDDDRRELVIYSDGSGGYVHTKEMGSSTPKAFNFVTQGLLNRISSLEQGADAKQDKLTAGANVTLAEDGTISVTCPSADTGWVSPGDWTLSVTPAEVSTLVSAETVVWTNAVQQVIGTATTSTTSSAPKMVALEMLDVSQPPPEVTFVCDGATLTRSENAQSALVSAETEGLYRLSATDDSGRVRSAYLSLRAPEVSTKLEEIYLADVPGTARAAVNDALLAALQTRDTSTTVQSGITAAVATGDQCFDASGAPLASAPLAPKFFCCVEPSRSWGPDAVAVAPHFAVTAAHWKPPQAKTATFRTPEGVSATVSGSWGISLVEWAQQRGYAAAEIRDANLGDIWVWQFDTGTIPDACIPYVLDRSGWEHYYHGDLSGIACYAITQNGYLSFGQLLRPDAGAYSIGLFSPRYTRADLLATLSPPACARIYGGDSGRPVMMIHEGEPVLLSTFRTAGSGPSLLKACEILDDLIKTRSGGTESLKRISAP
ncbi:MAG: hypothetical protein IKM62_01325 [Kiritimatiellae bacterium]|nr:hypothetical protein [Kiritimatiellia bacterium]